MAMPGEFDMEFAKKVMGEGNARQRRKIAALGLSEMEQQEMLNDLDAFLKMIILIAGNCIQQEHQVMLLGFLSGNLDDLIWMDRQPGGSITVNIDMVQGLCDKRKNQQFDEIARARLNAKEGSEILLIAQVLTNQFIMIGRSLPFRETFGACVKDLLKDLITVLGSGLPGDGITNLSLTVN